jgi:competence protein ComEA
MIRNFIAALIAAVALTAFSAAFAAVEANKASQADLETVKGIGPSLSGKILEARKTADFKNWDDLVDRVGGVGPGNAARFSQAGLTVGGASFQAKAASSDKPAAATKSPRPEAKAADKGEPKTGKPNT